MRSVQAAGEPPLTGGDDSAVGAPLPDGEQAPGSAADQGVPGRRRVGWLVAAAGFVFVADLATKTWVVHHFADGHVTTVVPHVLDLQEDRNAGAAFGIATGGTVVFSLVALVIAAVIVRTAPRLRSRPWALALGFVLGGAVGNLGDRLFRDPGVLRGRVVDWIHLHHWPVFNLADSGIVVGGVLALGLALWGVRPDGTRESEHQEHEPEHDPDRQPGHELDAEPEHR